MIDRRKRRRYVAFAIGGLTLLLMTVLALANSFSTFAPYDDESYVMMTIMTFHQGHPLYTDTYSQYGPGFYFLQSGLYDTLGLALTHDVTRLKTVWFWLCSAAAGAAIVHRITRVSAFGKASAGNGCKLCLVLVSFCVFGIHLQKLALEPGHPQEWALLLSLLAVLVVIGDGKTKWWLAGVLVAAVGLIKVNAGAVLALPLLCVAICQRNGENVDRNPKEIADKEIAHKHVADKDVAHTGAPDLLNFPFRALRFLPGADGLIRMLVFVAALLLPMIIVAANAQDFWHMVWPVSVGLSVASVLTGYWFHATKTRVWQTKIDLRTQGLKIPRWCGWGQLAGHSAVGLLAGAMSATLLITLWVVAMGTPIDWLGWGLIGQHQNMTKSFHHALTPTPWHWPWMVAASVVHVQWFWFRRTGLPGDAPKTWASALILAVIAVALFQCARDAFSPLVHGLAPRGGEHFLAIMAPWIMPWLLHDTVGLRDQQKQDRWLIALLGIFAPLLAFPTPGTQLAIGTLPVWIGLAVIASDRWLWQTQYVGAMQKAVAFSCVLLFSVAVFATGRWVGSTALDQPGCRWVRVDDATAKSEQSLARAIRDMQCDHLAFEAHNHNRFFFWTHSQTLTAINPTFWPALINPTHAAQIERAIQTSASPICVVRSNSDYLRPEHALGTRQKLLENWECFEEFESWKIGRSRPKLAHSQ